MANTANLGTYEPFADLLRVDPFFDTTALFDVAPMRRAWARMPAAPQIRMDIQEDKDAYFVKAEIPGVRKQDIHIMVENNTVTIEATVERKEEKGEGKTMLCTELYQGKVTRTFTLAADVDDTNAEAKYENGMLEIRLPKKAGARAKELTVA